MVEEKFVELIVFFIAQLDVRVVTVVKCFAEQQTRGGFRQKLYANTFGANLI